MSAVLHNKAGEKVLLERPKRRRCIREGLRLAQAWLFGCAAAVLTVADTIAACPDRPSLNGSTQTYELEISEPSLEGAALALAEQTELELLFPYNLAESDGVNPISGVYTVHEALCVMLDGSGFSGGLTKSGVITIVRNEDRRKSSEGIMHNDNPNLFSRFASGVSALAIAVFASGPGLAQEDQQGEASHGSAAALLYDQIVVTAEKRNVARGVQKAPLAVNAISGDAIEALQLDNVIDIGNTQPNVRLQSVGSVPGVANFSIRGIGFNSSVPSDEPTVGIVVDGVPLAATYGAYLDTFDLEAVEVLRGPQGTLFGRNSTGGAVTFRSRRPDGEFGARARIIGGSQERISFAASLEGPLLGDALAGKVAVMIEDRDGFFENASVEGDKVGERNAFFIRPMVVWSPSDTFDLTLIGEYADIDGDGSIAQSIGRPSDAINTFLGFTSAPAEDILFQDPESVNNTHWYQITAEANWRVGPGTLTSITGVRASELSMGEPSAAGPLRTDNDGTPFNVFNLQSLVDQEQFSQELRYAGSLFDDRLTFTFGAFFLTQDLIFQESRLIFGELGASPIATSSSLDQDSYGVFSQVELEAIPDVFIIAGGRYSSDTKNVAIASFGECDSIFNCTVGFEDKETFDDLSPKAGLRWEATDDILAYFTYTRGFRSGGYNFRNTAPATPGPYGDERVSALEFGLKTDLADGRIRANLALFRNSYDDIQRTVLVSVTEQNIANAASATVQGLELDVIINPVENFVLTGALGLIDGEFEEFFGLDVDGDGVPDPDLALGLQLERAPEVTYNIGGIYDIPLARGDMITLRANYSFTDETPINTINSSFLDSFGLLNASATYTFGDGRYSVTLFGKNLTDAIYGVTGSDTALGLTTYLEPPRTWGVEFKFEH